MFRARPYDLLVMVQTSEIPVVQPVRTSHLSPNRLEQAWPLVRELSGAPSLESWCNFARTMTTPAAPDEVRRGILVAERKRTIRGLVSYETVADITYGRVLFLRNVVILDLALGENIARALHGHSVEVAEETSCRSMHIEVTPPMSWIGEIWQQVSGGKVLPVTVILAPAPQDKLLGSAGLSVTNF